VTDRDRSNWESWMTRIPVENSKRIIKLSQILAHRLHIAQVDKYNVGRYALLQLEKALEREYAKIKPQSISA
jgi:hypothetical protein